MDVFFFFFFCKRKRDTAFKSLPVAVPQCNTLHPPEDKNVSATGDLNCGLARDFSTNDKLGSSFCCVVFTTSNVVDSFGV